MVEYRKPTKWDFGIGTAAIVVHAQNLRSDYSRVEKRDKHGKLITGRGALWFHGAISSPYHEEIIVDTSALRSSPKIFKQTRSPFSVAARLLSSCPIARVAAAGRLSSGRRALLSCVASCAFGCWCRLRRAVTCVSPRLSPRSWPFAALPGPAPRRSSLARWAPPRLLAAVFLLTRLPAWRPVPRVVRRVVRPSLRTRCVPGPRSPRRLCFAALGPVCPAVCRLDTSL